jgi:hypothetical protein
MQAAQPHACDGVDTTEPRAQQAEEAEEVCDQLAAAEAEHAHATAAFKAAQLHAERTKQRLVECEAAAAAAEAETDAARARLQRFQEQAARRAHLRWIFAVLLADVAAGIAPAEASD